MPFSGSVFAPEFPEHDVARTAQRPAAANAAICLFIWIFPFSRGCGPFRAGSRRRKGYQTAAQKSTFVPALLFLAVFFSSGFFQRFSSFPSSSGDLHIVTLVSPPFFLPVGAAPKTLKASATLEIRLKAGETVRISSA
ncbi:MAG: hypothetical protein IJ783_05570 [Kiritimatiellae bacterium]|nr:hypothetical protein [Kiritimatiellia bacterium]